MTAIPEANYLTLRSGLSIHYHEIGSAAGSRGTVLCLHGGGPGASGYSNYRRNMAAIADAGFHVLAPDLLGFGLSDKPDDNHWEWLEIWHKEQTQVAMDCRGNFFYQHNVFVRPVTYDAPPYDAMVEESLQPEAMTDHKSFVNAAGLSDEEYRHKAKLLAETSIRMTDIDKIDVIATSQYIFKWPAAR